MRSNATTSCSRDGWVTVGVRLEPENFAYARAIFYVLPDEAAARRLYNEQSVKPRLFHRDLGGPKPRPAPGVRPSVCGGGFLWNCHATGGRLYLVTQSGDNDPGSREVDPRGRAAAEDLITSFAELLGE